MSVSYVATQKLGSTAYNISVQALAQLVSNATYDTNYQLSTDYNWYMTASVNYKVTVDVDTNFGNTLTTKYYDGYNLTLDFTNSSPTWSVAGAGLTPITYAPTSETTATDSVTLTALGSTNASPVTSTWGTAGKAFLTADAALYTASLACNTALQSGARAGEKLTGEAWTALTVMMVTTLPGIAALVATAKLAYGAALVKAHKAATSAASQTGVPTLALNNASGSRTATLQADTSNLVTADGTNGVSLESGTKITVSASGDITITAGSGNTLTLSGGGTSLTLDSNGATLNKDLSVSGEVKSSTATIG